MCGGGGGGGGGVSNSPTVSIPRIPTTTPVVTPVVNKPTTTRLFDQDVMEKKPVKKPEEPKKPEDPKLFEALLTKLKDLVKKDDTKDTTVTPPAVSTKPKPKPTVTSPVVEKPSPVVEKPTVTTAPPATETPKKPVFDYGAV